MRIRGCESWFFEKFCVHAAWRTPKLSLSMKLFTILSLSDVWISEIDGNSANIQRKTLRNPLKNWKLRYISFSFFFCMVMLSVSNLDVFWYCLNGIGVQKMRPKKFYEYLKTKISSRDTNILPQMHWTSNIFGPTATTIGDFWIPLNYPIFIFKETVYPKNVWMCGTGYLIINFFIL